MRLSGRNLLPQHRLLEPAQFLTWLDPQLVREPGPAAADRAKSIALPAAPVKRQHQQAPQSLPDRMLGNQDLQLPAHLRLPPERKVGLDPARYRQQPKLLQP